MSSGRIGLPRSRALKNRLIWVTVRKACGGSSSPNADARSIKATLTRRTRTRSRSACAVARARSSKMGSSVLPAISRTSFSNCFAYAAVEVMLKVSPWRYAFRLDRFLPAPERGPVLLRALRLEVRRRPPDGFRFDGRLVEIKSTECF